MKKLLWIMVIGLCGITPNKPETIPSAKKPQVPNKMELIEN